MKIQKVFAAALIAAAGVFAMAQSASASTLVHVSLWDKGADMQMATDQAYLSPTYDASKATMGIKATPGTAKAGIVTFKVTNDSKDTIHEMIVMYMADPSKPLPYIDSEQRVDEDKAGDKGEVSELDPGASGSLTVNLQPGKYLLICNVPGHYAAGMWTEFTVTK
jgi:uncharacterized cupredoxin-like copper-binding protein